MMIQNHHFGEFWATLLKSTELLKLNMFSIEIYFKKIEIEDKYNPNFAETLCGIVKCI